MVRVLNNDDNDINGVRAHEADRRLHVDDLPDFDAVDEAHLRHQQEEGVPHKEPLVQGHICRRSNQHRRRDSGQDEQGGAQQDGQAQLDALYVGFFARTQGRKHVGGAGTEGQQSHPSEGLGELERLGQLLQRGRQVLVRNERKVEKGQAKHKHRKRQVYDQVRVQLAVVEPVEVDQAGLLAVQRGNLASVFVCERVRERL